MNVESRVIQFRKHIRQVASQLPITVLQVFPQSTQQEVVGTSQIEMHSDQYELDIRQFPIRPLDPQPPTHISPRVLQPKVTTNEHPDQFMLEI